MRRSLRGTRNLGAGEGSPREPEKQKRWPRRGTFSAESWLGCWWRREAAAGSREALLLRCTQELPILRKAAMRGACMSNLAAGDWGTVTLGNPWETMWNTPQSCSLKKEESGQFYPNFFSSCVKAAPAAESRALAVACLGTVSAGGRGRCSTPSSTRTRETGDTDRCTEAERRGLGL